jgi:cob(I)alamin adenosyltransferase
LRAIKDVIAAGKHQMIIMDEANVAVSSGLFSTNQLLEIIESKPHNVELVITGRGAALEIIERADQVSEVRPLKHYFKNGVTARVGIEK